MCGPVWRRDMLWSGIIKRISTCSTLFDQLAVLVLINSDVIQVQAPNTIRFITEEFSKSFPDDQNLGPARAPAEAWVKLRLGQVLPRNLDVILYMDADMVAQTSIEPLMKTDLKG